MWVNWSPWSVWVQKAWKHCFFKTRQKGAVQWILKRVNGFVLLIVVKEVKQKLVLQTLPMRRVRSAQSNRYFIIGKWCPKTMQLLCTFSERLGKEDRLCNMWPICWQFEGMEPPLCQKLRSLYDNHFLEGEILRCGLRLWWRNKESYHAPYCTAALH